MELFTREFVETETQGHLERVQHLTKKMIDRMALMGMRLDAKYRDQVVQFSALHDIGKSAISEKILYKKGPLDEQERMIVETHTLTGMYLLKHWMKQRGDLDRASAEIAENIVLYHHERWDGSGYPQALRGEEIPFEARLVSVVDVYDALTSDRCYKKAWTSEEALAFIEEQKGRFFDQQVVDVLLSLRQELAQEQVQGA